MLYIILLPVIGLILDLLINKFFPKAVFHGYDVLPFFFLPVCNMITDSLDNPSFLPYGLLFFFILVILITIESAVRNKNISLGKTFHKIWKYLAVCSTMWYIGLICLLIAQKI